MKKNFITKYLLLLLIVILSLSISGCTKKTDDNSSKKTSSTKTKETVKEDNPYKDLKIGVINIGASTDTSGYTFAHVNGIKGMMSTLGLTDEQVIYKDNVPDGAGDLATIKAAIQECIDGGCKIIFATSFGFSQAVSELAEQYPEVYFSHCSGELSNGKNFNRYFGKIYQPFYLAGIAAGLKTKTNKVGFVSAWGKVVSESAYCLDAFAMGVASVNQNAKVYSYAINSWGDENLETQAATFLTSHGADVVAQDTDSKAPQIIAEKANAFSIGYNSDMSKDAPNANLLSVIWNWSSYYTYAVKEIVAGTWSCPNYFGGMKEGLIGITTLSPTLNDPSAQAKITEATQKFTDGSWDVFTGVIPTNANTTVGTDGKTLDDDTIQFKTNWLYKNVVQVGPNISK